MLIGPGLDLDGRVILGLDWEQFAFYVHHGAGVDINFPADPAPQKLLDLNWKFRANPNTRRAFVLVTKDANHQLRMDPRGAGG